MTKVTPLFRNDATLKSRLCWVCGLPGDEAMEERKTITAESSARKRVRRTKKPASGPASRPASKPPSTTGRSPVEDRASCGVAPNLSVESTSQAQIPQAAAAGEASRAQRVARLRSAVLQGRYRVNAEEVAGKLINHMLDR